MNYNVDYFIQKFKAIPEQHVIACSINSPKGKCANGHCGVGMNYAGTKESHALEHLLCTLSVHWKTSCRGNGIGRPLKFDLSLRKQGGYVYSWTAETINDNLTHEYQQPTPKQRILAALRDVKKQQEKQVPVRERVTCVVIPESVSKELKKQAEETVLS